MARETTALVGEPPANHPAFALGPDVDLEVVREVAAGCRACDLWANATQTVFGEGRTRAPLMLVGEQPGDKEDLAGHPFVDRPVRCSIALWRKLASTASGCSSRTSSSTSSGARAESGASTSGRTL